MSNPFLKILILFILSGSFAFAQNQNLPDWYTADLKANLGIWTTDNSEYKSDEEPYDGYGMEWTWGIGKSSLRGRLYGIQSGQATGDFWEFEQYWDPQAQKAVLVQHGHNNIVGTGTAKPFKNGQIEAIQTFSMPGLEAWEERHLNKIEGNTLTTLSFRKDKSGKWVQKRSYTWTKKEEKDSGPDLGIFSVSLAVKDLKVSLEFYQKLGFEAMEGAGGLEQKWLILQKADTKIGLFQDMFPTNTLTFNPEDARAIHLKVKKGEIPVLFSMGLENKSGPCTFSIADPDGNPILIDQH